MPGKRPRTFGRRGLPLTGTEIGFDEAGAVQFYRQRQRSILDVFHHVNIGAVTVAAIVGVIIGWQIAGMR